MENDSKRPTQNDAVSFSRWENMNAEILGQIFVKIFPAADELNRTVSLVCKGWYEVVVGPYCWADINIPTPSYSMYIGDDDVVIKNLVRHSNFSVRRLSTYYLGTQGFEYVTKCGRFLTVLEIPWSEITDDMVENHVGSLVNLKELDISLCMNITDKGVSYFGNSCRSLTKLTRYLLPSDDYADCDYYSNGEAYAIATTMRGHRHLELGDGFFNDSGLNEILTNCKSLTHLHIQQCYRVSDDLKQRCKHIFHKPL